MVSLLPSKQIHILKSFKLPLYLIQYFYYHPKIVIIHHLSRDFNLKMRTH